MHFAAAAAVHLDVQEVQEQDVHELLELEVLQMMMLHVLLVMLQAAAVAAGAVAAAGLPPSFAADPIWEQVASAAATILHASAPYTADFATPSS